MHEFIREYAAGVARRDFPDLERRAALRRVVAFYAQTSFAGERILAPFRRPIRITPFTPDVPAHPLPDVPTALAWFESEYGNLLAAQRTASAQGWHDVVFHLAWTLVSTQSRGRSLDDRLAVWQSALEAAEHLPEPGPRIFAHRQLGLVQADFGCHHDATEHLHEALALASRHHDLAEQADVHQALARTG